MRLFSPHLASVVRHTRIVLVSESAALSVCVSDELEERNIFY